MTQSIRDKDQYMLDDLIFNLPNKKEGNSFEGEGPWIGGSFARGKKGGAQLARLML
jgi:hypothetical protein